MNCIYYPKIRAVHIVHVRERGWVDDDGPPFVDEIWSAGDEPEVGKGG